jgi:hypothetical protein
MSVISDALRRAEGVGLGPTERIARESASADLRTGSRLDDTLSAPRDSGHQAPEVIRPAFEWMAGVGVLVALASVVLIQSGGVGSKRAGMVGMVGQTVAPVGTEGESVSTEVAPSRKASVEVIDAPLGYRLAGVIMGGEKSLALINGEMLGLGERIDGAEVVDIAPDKVLMRNSSGVFWIRVRGGSVGATSETPIESPAE